MVDTADKLVPTLVVAEGFRGAQIVMVAAGGLHSVALGAAGRVWTWGWGKFVQLGHNNMENRLVPTLLAGEVLGGAAAVLVATWRLTYSGSGRAMGVGIWRLWPVGPGRQSQQAGTDSVVVSEAAFGGSSVLMLACGDSHSLVVTKDCTLWTFGSREYGELVHTDSNTILVPTRIKAQHFGNAKIISIASGFSHSAAVTEDGTLYT